MSDIVKFFDDLEELSCIYDVSLGVHLARGHAFWNVTCMPYDGTGMIYLDTKIRGFHFTKEAVDFDKIIVDIEKELKEKYGEEA